jgi:predicted glycogen debranching enzyme
VALAETLYPVLKDIIRWHERGTRFNICVDPVDGLLNAGQSDIQLTWMDVKIGDWVVTPRTGKPVEVNALWFNALCIITDLARKLGNVADAAHFEAMAAHARESFNHRFWYEGGYLYDVIDTPEDIDDPTLRPNQLIAVSLPCELIDGDRARAVVDVCAAELVTSYGLRSLDPNETDYSGHFGGNVRSRDSAYHQGTVWAWLMGPFVTAHYKVYRDAARAMSYLEPFADHLMDAGLGTISEVFEGDPPHAPKGCIAQAWSVAEVLRAYRLLESELREKVVRARP